MSKLFRQQSHTGGHQRAVWLACKALIRTLTLCLIRWITITASDDAKKKKKKMHGTFWLTMDLLSV